MSRREYTGSGLGFAGGVWNEERNDAGDKAKSVRGFDLAKVVRDDLFFRGAQNPTSGTILLTSVPVDVVGFVPAQDTTTLLPVDQLPPLVGLTDGNAALGPGSVDLVNYSLNGIPGTAPGDIVVGKDIVVGASAGGGNYFLVGHDNRGKLIEEDITGGLTTDLTFACIYGVRVEVAAPPATSLQINQGPRIGLHYPIAGDEVAVVTSQLVTIATGAVVARAVDPIVPPSPTGDPRGKVYFQTFTAIDWHLRLTYLASRVDQREA